MWMLELPTSYLNATMLQLLCSYVEPQTQNLLSIRFTHRLIKQSATKLWQQTQWPRSSQPRRQQASQRWCVQPVVQVHCLTPEPISQFLRSLMNCLTTLIYQANLQILITSIFLRLFCQTSSFTKNPCLGKKRMIKPFRKAQEWSKFKNGKIFWPEELDTINMEKLAGPIGLRLSIWVTSGLHQ